LRAPLRTDLGRKPTRLPSRRPPPAHRLRPPWPQRGGGDRGPRRGGDEARGGDRGGEPHARPPPRPHGEVRRDRRRGLCGPRHGRGKPAGGRRGAPPRGGRLAGGPPPEATSRRGLTPSLRTPNTTAMPHFDP